MIEPEREKKRKRKLEGVGTEERKGGRGDGKREMEEGKRNGGNNDSAGINPCPRGTPRALRLHLAITLIILQPTKHTWIAATSDPLATPFPFIRPVHHPPNARSPSDRSRYCVAYPLDSRPYRMFRYLSIDDGHTIFGANQLNTRRSRALVWV